MRLAVALVLAPVLASSHLLQADQEAANAPHVQASEYGRCYAKSVPTERHGNAGTTTVFRVAEGADEAVHEFDWYAPRLRLACNVSDGQSPVGVSIVQLGPWQRGHAASEDHLALAFYFKGEKVAEYSTLDLAGRPDNVSASVSHYVVMSQIIGYEFRSGNRGVFQVRTHDGRTLSFDAASGGRLP